MRYFMKVFVFIVVLLGSAYASGKVTQKECINKGDNFLFAGGECIQFYEASADRPDTLTIIVHGTWKEGTNTLGRYATFADNLAIETDITTVAVALPGYSGSSTNFLQALSHDGETNLAFQKRYIEFLSKLVLALKNKYKAKVVTYIGHSAGAAMGATLLGYKPKLVNNFVGAGGRYDIHKTSKNPKLISAIDYLDKIDKNTNIVLVYGTKDKISPPNITKSFYKIAKGHDFSTSIVKVNNAVHLDLDMSDTSVAAIVKLLEE